MQGFNKIISDFKKMSREIKTTLFPLKRYIIPRDWFDNIMNNRNNKSIISINNSQFLNTSLKYFNSNIDERKIVLLTFELMIYIHKSFQIDYIIQVNISFDKENIIYINNNIEVFNNNEFNETNVSLHKNITIVNETYLKYPHFQILKSNKNTDISSNKNVINNEKELLSRTDR